jgi:hypothetical protein
MLHTSNCLQVISELSFEDRHTIAKIKICLFSNLIIIKAFFKSTPFPIQKFYFLFFSISPHIYTWCSDIAISTPATYYRKVQSDMLSWLSSVRPAECENDANHDYLLPDLPQPVINIFKECILFCVSIIHMWGNSRKTEI